jgi:hypothetical protein
LIIFFFPQRDSLTMDPQAKEEFRRAVRAYLAERPSLAFNENVIQRHVTREVPCTAPEVLAACDFLKDLGHIKEVPNSMGSLRYFQITAQGTLAHERGD